MCVGEGGVGDLLVMSKRLWWRPLVRVGLAFLICSHSPVFCVYLCLCQPGVLPEYNSVALKSRCCQNTQEPTQSLPLADDEMMPATTMCNGSHISI